MTARRKAPRTGLAAAPPPLERHEPDPRADDARPRPGDACSRTAHAGRGRRSGPCCDPSRRSSCPGAGRADGGTLTRRAEQAPPRAPAPARAAVRLLPQRAAAEAAGARRPARRGLRRLREALGGTRGGRRAAAAARASSACCSTSSATASTSARDAGSGRPVDAERYYHFQPGRGVLAVRDVDAGPRCPRGPRPARRWRAASSRCPRRSGPRAGSTGR